MAWYNPLNWLGLTVSQVPDPGDNVKPAKGEQTGRQDSLPFFGLGEDWYGSGSITGYSQSPPATFHTYRRMETEWPTLQLAYCMSLASILFPWKIEADEDASPEAEEYANKYILPLIPDLVRSMFRAMTLRYSPHEVVWELVDGYMVPTKFKPLMQEQTQILITDKGDVVGLRQGQEDLLGPNAFTYTNQPEVIPIYGQSRCEYVRKTWWKWHESQERGAMLDKKASSIVPTILAPDGSVKYTKADGTTGTSFALAKEALSSLMQGIGVVLPNKLSMMKGGSVADYAKWAETTDFKIELHDLGNVGPANESLLKKLQYYDSLAFRGWGFPERSALEGTHGTKAEAGEHGEYVTESAEQRRDDFAESINHGPICAAMRLNFGEQSVGKVKLVPIKIKDERTIFYGKTFDAMLKNADLAGKIAMCMDMPDFFETLQLKVNDQAKIDDPLFWAMQQKQEAAGNKPPGKNGQNGNGTDDEDELAAAARFGRMLRGIE